jgi:hypothetical protein
VNQLSDYNGLTRLMNSTLPTAIIKYPTGRYGIAGSVPYELTRERRTVYSVIRVSNTYDTEQAVIDALLGIGIDRFQLSDCTWYDREAG